MGKVKTVLVRNERNRVYNGIKYMQIVEINEDSLYTYLIAGFLQFDKATGKSFDPRVPAEEAEDQGDGSVQPTAEEAKAYLDEKNISYAKNISDAKVIERALENGLSPNHASKDINTDGLDKINEWVDGDNAGGSLNEDLGELADTANK